MSGYPTRTKPFMEGFTCPGLESIASQHENVVVVDPRHDQTTASGGRNGRKQRSRSSKRRKSSI